MATPSPAANKIDLSVTSIDDPNVSDKPESIMIIGAPGTGKTSQFATLPGRKFLYVFDPNCIQSLRGRAHNIDFKEFIPDYRDLNLAVQTLKKDVGDKKRAKVQATTYVDWEADFDARIDTGFFNNYDWIGFDSFTTFAEIVMDRVLDLTGHPGKHPEQADWTSQMNTIKNVFRTATNLNLNLWCVCHTEVRRDEQAGRAYGMPIMTGRLRVRLPMLFSQIFATSAEKDGDAYHYYVTTKPSREHPLARTNIPGLKDDEIVDIDWKKSAEGQGVGGILMKANKIKLKKL